MAANEAAVIPSILAQSARRCGRATIKETEMKITIRPCKRHRSPTVKAVRQVGCLAPSDVGNVGLRGKKTRKRKSLFRDVSELMLTCVERA
jgi:hypothetical protein